MKNLYLVLAIPFLLGIFFSNPLSAQNYPPNTYRSSENHLYWKNKPPYAGYWQQDIYYKIKAKLDDKTGIVTGSEQLTYWNNSPDTLKFVYFHLYSNAFTPNSYNSKVYRANKQRTWYGPYEQHGLGIEVTKMESGGKSLKMEVDNTIMKVYLDKPLPPNSSTTFDVDFRNYFDVGSIRRRMKIFVHDGYKHFDCVHWYPRISVYDRKEGWDENQHLDREFYGDYGTYDVSLTLPANYVIGATGSLLNEDKVLPPALRQKLDIKNFANKPLGEKPSVIIPADTTTKTWIYHAINVHDFAWTADPTYRLGETDWHGIRCIAIAQEENASRWQTASDFTAKLIEIYSKDFGLYEWPVIQVADAQDGMEYPMITLCGGLEPDFHYVISHEVGHEWFFGMLGNNETYRAMMDEGFTQFLTAWSMIKIDGETEKKAPPASKYLQKYQEPQNTLDGVLYNSYLRTAQDQDNIPINTHSDYFNSAVGHGGGYGQVYFKTGTMLYNLQYVLGDTLFQNAMRYYVSKWKICHPYVEDFEDAIIEYTHYNLKWFFDAWITTNKCIDYGVKSVKLDSMSTQTEEHGSSDAGAASNIRYYTTSKTMYNYTVTLVRKGGLQMPIDFTVYTKNRGKFNYYIPCSYDMKTTDANILKPWIGWDKLNPEYKAEIHIDDEITNVVIDTTRRLADVNELDNQWKCPARLGFDHLVYKNLDRMHYNMTWRPDLWYNGIDGFKVGLHLEGGYFVNDKTFSATAWYNTGLLNQQAALLNGKTIAIAPVSGLISYADNLRSIDNSLRWTAECRALDGLYLGKVGITRPLKNGLNFGMYYKAMIRPNANDLDYLLYPTQWQADKWNNTLNAYLKKDFENFKSWGNYTINLRTAGPGSNYNYSSLSFEARHNMYLGKLLLRSRAIAGYEDGAVPAESEIYLASASPEDMMENKFIRSVGFEPASWLGYGAATNHLAIGGGLGARGYSGYLAPETVNGNQIYTYAGNAGAAINMELDFSGLFTIHPKTLHNYLSLNPYLFGDAAVINASGNDYTESFVNPRIDAGAGLALNIKSWGALQKVQPLTLRFDMPFFLSSAPYTDQGNFAFRWMVGVNRAF